MRQAWQIFRQDIHRLFHNWAAILVVCGVCALPSLYAWFNIAANMDPYGNTGTIQVAVANLDTTATSGTMTLNAGDSIVEALKKNDQLGWCFVDEDTALAGVRSGQYFAAIVIPQNFSQCLLSVLSGSLEQAPLRYYVNEKENAVAPKITDTGADTVQRTIDDTFTSAASGAIASLVRTYASTLTNSMSNTGDETLSTLTATRADLTHCNQLLAQFQTLVSTSNGKIPAALVALQRVCTTAQSGADTLNKASETILDLRSALGTFSAQLSQDLSDSEQELTDLYNTLSSQLGTLDNTTQQALQKIDTATQALQNTMDKNSALATQLEQMAQSEASAVPALAQEADELKKQDTTLNDMLSGLRSERDALQSIANDSSTLREELKTLSESDRKALRQLQTTLTQEIVPQMQQALDKLAALSSSTATLLEDSIPVVQQLEQILRQLSASLTSDSGTLVQTQTALSSIDTQLQTLATDVSALQASSAYKQLLTLEGISVQSISDFMYSPVTIQSEVLYPVKNYGSAMTPFYTNLALWVGGLILASIFKQEVAQPAAGPRYSAFQAYWGRWLLFVILGIVQSLIVCAGDIWLLKVQCVHPAAFLFAGVICSFVYVNFVYALALTFKHIGKAIAVILVILQIPGSSGTYPIQMTPKFFQAICPFLPFTYGINAMREAIAGMYGDTYVKNLLLLCLFLPISWGIGLVLRPLVMDVTYLFDRRLGGTELMEAETDDTAPNRPKLQMLLTALFNNEAEKQVLTEKAARFEKRYPTLVRVGLWSMLLIPSVFLILLFSVETKLVFLVLWVIFLIALAIYLIVVEYIHDKLQMQRTLDNTTSSDLMTQLKENVQ